MIESVRLKNFLSHSDSYIQLFEGVNVFVGRNGAGKSSVIDAITYAFFGEHSRGDNRNLVRRGAREGFVEVVFSVGGRRYAAARRLGADGRLTEAVLREESEGGRWRIVASGERRQLGESTREAVESILGLDYERLRVAAIVRQGELDSIITEYRPSELKELINGLIGIDALDAAYEASRDLLSAFRDRLRKEYGYDDQDAAQLEEELRRASEEAKELEARAAQLEEELRRASEERSKMEEELAVLEEKRRKLAVLEEKRRNLFERVAALRKELEGRLEELDDVVQRAGQYLEVAGRRSVIESRLKELEEDRRGLADRLEALVAGAEALRRLEASSAALEEELRRTREMSNSRSNDAREFSEEASALEKEAADNPGSPEELRRLEEELEGRLRSQDSLVGALRARLDDYRRIAETGVCPTCGSRIERGDAARRAAQLEEELRRASEERSKMEEELRNVRGLRAKAERYEELRRRLEEARRRAARASEEAKELEARAAQLEEELRRASEERSKLLSVKAEYAEARSKLREVEEAIRAERSKLDEVLAAEAWLAAKGVRGPDDVRALAEEASSLRSKISALPADPAEADLESLRVDEVSSRLVDEVKSLEAETSGFSEERYEELRRRLEEARRREAELERRRGEVEGRLRGLREEVERIRSVLGELAAAARYAHLLERIRSDVFNRDGPVATSLRSWALEEIGRRASDYVRLFSIGISSVELKDERREVKMTCYSGSGERDVRSMSGGEKVALALALRFAMADLMGKGRADFVILDEPTTHLDSERRKALVDIISALNSAQEQGRLGVNQIIIITHDKEIFENSDVNAVLEFEASPSGTRVRPLPAAAED